MLAGGCCYGGCVCCLVAVAVVMWLCMWLLSCGCGCCPVAVAVVLWLWLLSCGCCHVAVPVVLVAVVFVLLLWNIRHTNKIFEILATKKISPFCTMTSRKDPKMHRNYT